MSNWSWISVQQMEFIQYFCSFVTFMVSLHWDPPIYSMYDVKLDSEDYEVEKLKPIQSNTTALQLNLPS